MQGGHLDDDRLAGLLPGEAGAGATGARPERTEMGERYGALVIHPRGRRSALWNQGRGYDDALKDGVLQAFYSSMSVRENATQFLVKAESIDAYVIDLTDELTGYGLWPDCEEFRVFDFRFRRTWLVVHEHVLDAVMREFAGIDKADSGSVALDRITCAPDKYPGIVMQQSWTDVPVIEGWDETGRRVPMATPAQRAMQRRSALALLPSRLQAAYACPGADATGSAIDPRETNAHVGGMDPEAES
jgi:hypothetical protein